MPCSLVKLARVVVRVLVLVDVICVMIVVLIAHVDVVAENVQFSYPFSVVEMYSLQIKPRNRLQLVGLSGSFCHKR